MGGVNLSEESKNILASNADFIGTQIRSCKDEAFLFHGALLSKITAIGMYVTRMILTLWLSLRPPRWRRGSRLDFGSKIRVRFPAYPHRVRALWWQGGKRCLRTSRCPCRGRLGTLKTPSCPWRGCPAAGQNLETGHLSRHYIAEISLNVTLNHNQLNSTDCPYSLYAKVLSISTEFRRVTY